MPDLATAILFYIGVEIRQTGRSGRLGSFRQVCSIREGNWNALLQEWQAEQAATRPSLEGCQS